MSVVNHALKFNDFFADRKTEYRMPAQMKQKVLISLVT